MPLSNTHKKTSRAPPKFISAPPPRHAILLPGLVSFSRKLKLLTSVQSILATIFRVGLLRLSAGTYEATSSTAVNVVSHWEWF